ncbi:MAG: T9SS type A sorting domain-containing protein [Bacteroidota bacterium]
MKPLFTTLAYIIVLAVYTNTVSAQIIYIDLNIEQPNVEDCITNIETNFQVENIKVYPNPVKGLFTVTLNKSIVNAQLKMSIYNLNGKEIFTEEFKADHTKFEKNIDLSGHPSGIYLLTINSKEKYYRAEIILK